MAAATARLDLGKMRRFVFSRLPARSHDDGSYGPLMLRYAWHLCGTYDAVKNSGGSNGNTMRFSREKNDPENAGFALAERFVERVEQAFPGVLSRADVQVFCGGLAIEHMGGPRMPFRYGRRDFTEAEAGARYPDTGGCPFGDGEFSPHGSRLPAADLGRNPGCPHHEDMAVREKPTIDAVRGTFRRMGFDDRETVCLIVLGHQFGRCHPDVSGYEHPWYVFDPAHWNIYEHGLGYLSAYTMGRYAEEQSSAGKRQFNFRMGGGEPFMMLVSDMALLWDEGFRKWLTFYDRHRRQFAVDAVAAWTKLTELGCEEVALVEPRYS
jgi:catalase (peroxidase I)